jgi:anti-repressor protein
MSITTTTDLVIIENNLPTTTSLKIAEYFGKNHSKILRDIKKLLESGEIAEANFGLSSYTDNSGKSNPMYQITKDGFTLLTMGFTGAKALKFKVDYINAFNKMEQTLKNQIQAPTPQPALPNFDANFFKQIAQTIETLELDKSKLKLEVETKDNTISNLTPKADFVDNVLVKGNTGLTAMSIVAKEMGLGSVRLYKILRDEKIWFWALNEHGVNENNVKQDYIDNGSFVVKAFYSERDKRTYDKIFATNKGKLLCYKLVKESQNAPKFEIKLIENNQK